MEMIVCFEALWVISLSPASNKLHELLRRHGQQGVNSGKVWLWNGLVLLARFGKEQSDLFLKRRKNWRSLANHFKLQVESIRLLHNKVELFTVWVGGGCPLPEVNWALSSQFGAVWILNMAAVKSRSLLINQVLFLHKIWEPVFI